MNALTHGLTAKKILIPGETEEQFDELLQGLIADFTPGTTIECEQVYYLATLCLRRRRPAKVDAALQAGLMYPSFAEMVNLMTDEEIDQMMKIYMRILKIEELPDPSQALEHQHENDDQEKSILRRIELLNLFARYEAHITNEIIKTVRLILLLQERRMAA